MKSASTCVRDWLYAHIAQPFEVTAKGLGINPGSRTNRVRPKGRPGGGTRRTMTTFLWFVAGLLYAAGLCVVVWAIWPKLRPWRRPSRPTRHIPPIWTGRLDDPYLGIFAEKIATCFRNGKEKNDESDER